MYTNTMSNPYARSKNRTSLWLAVSLLVWAVYAVEFFTKIYKNQKNFRCSVDILWKKCQTIRDDTKLQWTSIDPDFVCIYRYICGTLSCDCFDWLESKCLWNYTNFRCWISSTRFEQQCVVLCVCAGYTVWRDHFCAHYEFNKTN